MGNTMNAADLHRILHNGLLFADTDQSLPMLTAVQLEFSGDKVVSLATDRYLMGMTRADYTGEEFTVLVNRFDVERVAKMAKPPTKGKATHEDRSVDIEHDADNARVTFVFSSGESVTVQTVDAQFPAIRRLLPTEQRPTGGYVAVNAQYLAKFARVISESKYDQMFLSAGAAHQPMAVRIGDHFVGMQMPVKTIRTGWELPAWI
jgi:DNA polymerase III sliding clamp (beta) subunit (PCNA family)